MPPVVLSSSYSGDKITLNFSEPLLAGALPDLAQWTLAGTAAGRTVTAQSFVDGDTLELTVSGGALTGTPSLSYANPAQVNPVLPPAAANYSIPGGATVVSSIGALETALASGTAQDIKVMNGSYLRTAPITPAAAHRVWAESVDGVVYNFGFQWNNNIGWRMHGGTITLGSAARAADDGVFKSAIHNWLAASSNSNAQVTDMKLNCGFFAAVGANIRRVGGVIMQRVVVRDTTDFGVFIHDNSAASTSVISTISDLDIANVYRLSPHRGAANGTAESGLTLGHEVTNDVLRVKIRNTGWQGIALNLAFKNTDLYDLDVDDIYGALPSGQVDDGRTGTGSEAALGTGTAMYVEHTTSNVNVYRYLFGTNIYRGFNGEWNLGTPGNAAMNGFKARHGRVITSRVVDALRKKYGFYASDGSRDVGISDTVFKDMNAFCTGWYNDDTAATTVADFQNNDWSGRASGAKRVTNSQLNDYAIGSHPESQATDGTPPRRLLAAT